jgi:hypothetical protein
MDRFSLLTRVALGALLAVLVVFIVWRSQQVSAQEKDKPAPKTDEISVPSGVGYLPPLRRDLVKFGGHEQEADRARLAVLQAMEHVRNAEDDLRKAKTWLREVEEAQYVQPPSPSGKPATPALHVIKLHYASAPVLAVMLIRFIERLDVIADERANVIILKGEPADMLAAARLVGQLDVPDHAMRPRGDSPYLVPLQTPEPPLADPKTLGR